MQESNVVDVLSNMRKKIRNPLPALAVLLELPLRPNDASLIFFATAALCFDLDRLPVETVEFRLVIERVNMTGATIHEQKDHALGLGCEVRGLRR